MTFNSDGTTYPSELIFEDYPDSHRQLPVSPSSLQQVEVVPKQFLDLTDAEIALWKSIHATYPSLSSPYYHPEFLSLIHI